jgi:hypothetical protein
VAERRRARAARADDRQAASRGRDDDQYDKDDEAEPLDEYDEGYEEELDQEPDEETPAQRRNRSQKLSVTQAARIGLRQIAQLTAKNPAGVTSVEPVEDGWVVGVEVVEDHRVPSSADILAVYEAAIGTDGTVVSYRRTRRYPRGRGNDTGAG